MANTKDSIKWKLMLKNCPKEHRFLSLLQYTKAKYGDLLAKELGYITIKHVIEMLASELTVNGVYTNGKPEKQIIGTIYMGARQYKHLVDGDNLKTITSFKVTDKIQEYFNSFEKLSIYQVSKEIKDFLKNPINFFRYE